MMLGRVAVGGIAVVALLSGCAQNTASASAADSAAEPGGPGVTAFLGHMRSAEFVVVDKPSESASAERRVAEALKFDGRLLLAGNAVCDVAAGKGVRYGRIVQEIVDSSDSVGGTGSFIAQKLDPAGKVLNAISYDDQRVMTTKLMDFRMAESIVRAAVPNLCPALGVVLPGFTPAT